MAAVPAQRLLVMLQRLPWVAEADVPKRRASAVKGIAGTAVLREGEKLQTFLLPTSPPCLAQLSMDPNVVRFKFLDSDFGLLSPSLAPRTKTG